MTDAALEALHAILDRVAYLRWRWPSEPDAGPEPIPASVLFPSELLIEAAKAVGRWKDGRIEGRWLVTLSRRKIHSCLERFVHDSCCNLPVGIATYLHSSATPVGGHLWTPALETVRGFVFSDRK